jgi:hypothetical protein
LSEMASTLPSLKSLILEFEIDFGVDMLLSFSCFTYVCVEGCCIWFVGFNLCVL